MQKSGEACAVILVKAAPQVGRKHGELVCCAGVSYDLHKPIPPEWLRLYPISFRHLDDAQQFTRWDIVRFRWRLPSNDRRPESRRVEHETLEIIGKLNSVTEKQHAVTGLIVTSLERERQKGKSFALLRPEIEDFFWRKKTQEQLEKEEAMFRAARSQGDLFSRRALPEYKPCPYEFCYRYRTDDGARTGTCQDWETDATFFKWRQLYDEKDALLKMQERLGDQYPREGMLLAMGTHSRYPSTWLINGIIKLPPVDEPFLI